MNTKDFEVTKDLQLNSITHGNVSLEEAVKYIVDYLSADKQAKYEIAIGTDSMTRLITEGIPVGSDTLYVKVYLDLGDYGERKLLYSYTLNSGDFKTVKC